MGYRERVDRPCVLDKLPLVCGTIALFAIHPRWDKGPPALGTFPSDNAAPFQLVKESADSHACRPGITGLELGNNLKIRPVFQLVKRNLPSRIADNFLRHF